MKIRNIYENVKGNQMISRFDISKKEVKYMRLVYNDFI